MEETSQHPHLFGVEAGAGTALHGTEEAVGCSLEDVSVAGHGARVDGGRDDSAESRSTLSEMLLPIGSRFIDLGDGPVHIADFGGRGGPVVCVHGLGGSHVNWMACGEGLQAMGHVTAIDLVGFGLTPPLGRSASVEANRALLGRYLAGFDEPALVVANSMGGAIAMAQAAAAPETVRALVLVSPALPRPRHLSLDPKVVAGFGLILVPGLAKAAVSGRRLAMTPEESVRFTLDLCAAHPEHLSPEVLEAHFDLARRRVETGGWDEAFIGAARSLIAMLIRRFAFDRMISQIEAPALVVQGRQDRLVPYQAVERIGSLRPDWEIRILDGVGHIAMLEVPRTFTDLVLGWSIRAAA